MRTRSVLFLALLGFITATAVYADEGRIPLWESTVLAGPGIDGSYILTRNIVTPAGGGAALTILGTGFEEVKIDLNGFTIFGDPAGGSDIIRATSLRSLVITNGSVRAVGPPPGASVRIEDSEKVVVSDIRISDGGEGVFLERVSGFDIRGNLFAHTDGASIFVDGGGGLPSPTTGTIEDNVINEPVGDGIVVANVSSSVAIRDNRIDRPLNGTGINVIIGDDCLIAENTVEDAATEGIFLETVKGCKLYNNVVTRSGFNGFLLGDVSGTLVLDNVSTDNGGSGINQVGGGLNQYDRNVLTGNRCYGLWLGGPDNTFGRNTARSNFGGGGPACPGGPAADCTAPAPPLGMCWPGGPPPGVGLATPDLCNAGPGNTTFCDNLMPGPPTN